MQLPKPRRWEGPMQLFADRSAPHCNWQRFAEADRTSARYMRNRGDRTNTVTVPRVSFSATFSRRRGGCGALADVRCGMGTGAREYKDELPWCYCFISLNNAAAIHILLIIVLNCSYLQLYYLLDYSCMVFIVQSCIVWLCFHMRLNDNMRHWCNN